MIYDSCKVGSVSRECYIYYNSKIYVILFEASDSSIVQPETIILLVS